MTAAILLLFAISQNCVGQNVSRIFLNNGLTDVKHPGRFKPIDTSMHFDPLKIEFTNKGEIIHTYSYGMPRVERVKFKILKNAGFDKAPKEIRGHKLMGVCYDSSLCFYNLYYLSPKKRPSLLILSYWRPGQMAIFRYLCSDTYNPFEDMQFTASLNDTIRLETKH